jgi:hypothetical protein
MSIGVYLISIKNGNYNPEYAAIILDRILEKTEYRHNNIIDIPEDILKSINSISYIKKILKRNGIYISKKHNYFRVIIY